MFKKYKSTSVLKRYILSFLMISMIPLIIISFFFYRYNLDAVRKNVQLLNHYQLTQITSIFESEYEKYFYTAKRLEQEPNLSYRNLTGTWIEKKDALNAFQYHMVDAINIGEPFLFVRNSDMVYSKDGTMDYDAMASRYYSISNQEKERFKKWLSDTKAPAIASLQIYESTGKINREKIVFQFPISNKRIAAFFVVDKNDYLSFFTNMVEDTNGYVFISDNIHETVATNSRNMEDSKALSRFLEERTSESDNILKLSDGEPYSITSMKSIKMGWHCTIALPESMYYSKTLEDINFLILIFAAVGLLGAGAGIVLSFVNYRPLRRILKEADIDNVPTIGNEYDMISRYFKQKAVQNHQLREKITSQTPYVKDRVLDILLYSDITQQDFENETKDIDLGFGEPYFFVITIEPERTLEAAQQSRHIKEIMEKVDELQRNLAIPFLIYSVEHFGEKEPSLIVNIRDLSYKEPLFTKIQEELQQISKQYTKLNFGCGNAYNSIWSLRKSYQEAKVVIEHNIGSKGSRISVIDEIQKSKNMGIPDYPAPNQSLFIQQIKEGDSMGAQESFESLCKSEVFQNGGEILQKYILYVCIEDILNLAKVINCNAFECSLGYLLNYENMQDLKDNILSATEKMCNVVNIKKHEKKDELKHEILEYITNNYNNHDLGLDNMSEHFGYSPVYLSRFIREQTGFNFKDYVTEIRMIKAKQMLINTELSIKDIVERIGYYNVSSFIRKFRTIEGVTPGEYRARTQVQEIKADDVSTEISAGQ